MAQHDYNIANNQGSAFRSDLNDMASAIVTLNSGATEPATTYAGMLWLDTSVTPPVIKQRNQADNAWDTLASLMDAQIMPSPSASGYVKRNAANDGNETKTAQQVADELLPLLPLLPSVPIGGYVIVQTDITGAEAPPAANFIRLKSGLTGSGQYNEGKLASESVSGSAPTISATAVIDDAESPIYGQTVRLLEDERRFLRPGSPGTLEDSALGSHGHTASGTANSSGAHTHTVSFYTGSGSAGRWEIPGRDPTVSTVVDFSAPTNTAGQHTHTVTVTVDNAGDTETRPRSLGVAVYMRIK